MAVIVNYSWQFVQNLDLTAGPSTGLVDVTGLANGGFAAVGQHGTHSDLDIFNASSAHSGQALNTGGEQARIAQLTNGNMAVAAHGASANATISILNGSGGFVLSPTAIVDSGAVGLSNTDVAALTGGNFVVVYTGTLLGAALNATRAGIYNSAGTQLLTFTVQAGAIEPVVAGLDDGGFAVAWQEGVEGVNQSIWIAVYNANGSVRRAPIAVDGVGSINRNVAITATDGGFAIVYEDNELSTNTNITLMRFTSSGLLDNLEQISGSGTIDETPQIARMPNGLLAISWTSSSVGPADSETVVALYDPQARNILAQRTVTAGEPLTDDTDAPAIAAHGVGNLAVFHTNRTDNDVDGEDLRVVRTSTGDAAADLISGSSYIDIINGGGGNDELVGNANNDTLNGDAGDDGLELDSGNDVLNGGEGIDTVLANNSSSGVTINLSLTGPQAIGGGLGTDTLSLIENISGSQFGDTLTGNSSANLISGGAGNDTMAGGLGNDTYLQPEATDTIIEAAGAGIDEVVIQFGVSYSLASVANVENLTYSAVGPVLNFTGTGNGLDNRITGNLVNDTLSGLAGNDTLEGKAGDDTLDGGFGSDTAVYASATGGVGANLNLTGPQDVGGGEGIDTLISIENVIGSNFADLFAGNSDNNRLDGGSGGVDTVDYRGATGTGVTVNLASGQAVGGGQGVDTLISIENVAGSSFADVLIGNAQVNVLQGFDGNDVYYIDALDSIFEGSGVNSGIDTIYAKFNVNLASYADVENLVLYGGGPTSGTGTDVKNVMNALSNTNGVTLTGLDGDDVLHGSNYADTLNGGNGKDTMFGYAALGGINTMNGGANDDAYYSSRATDVINENLNEGFDIVFAIVNRTLSANTEYLYIYGTATSGTGNTLANTINGFNSAQSLTLDGAQGNDVIYGSNQADVIIGGTQNDVMNGYGGADRFRFAAAGTGADQIYGFDADATGGQDLIDVSGRGFNAGSIGGAIVISASGANTLITIGADTILLHAVASANVTAADFVF